MDPWNLGIFTIMSIMVTIIGIVLVLRFAYVDNRYNDIIKNNELEIQQLNEKKDELEIQQLNEKKDELEIQQLNEKKDELDSENPNIILKQLIISLTIGEYKTKRTDNRGIGAGIDLFCLFAIMILGIFATFGFFANSESFTLLVVLLMMLFSAPLLNFILQVNHVNKYKSI